MMLFKKSKEEINAVLLLEIFGGYMRHYDRRRILVFLLASLLLAGCSTTIQETKSTDTDPGNITQLKFTGSKMKVVHDF